MGKNYNKYYLMVNDILIDFSKIWGFSGMENFLKLSIFTGIFRNKDELIKCLISLGLLPNSTPYDDVKIVKYIGKSKGEWRFVDVTEDIVYSGTLDFLSAASLRKFFYVNRQAYGVVIDILEECKKQTIALDTAFEIKIGTLQREASQSTGEDLEELYLEIEKKRNSQKNFRANIKNMNALITLAEKMAHTDGLVNRELILEYTDRLDVFVINEIYYINGAKKSINERGLVRLALTVSKIAYKNPALVKPFMTTSNSNVRLELLRAVRSAMDFVICQVDESECFDSGKDDIDTDIEPDNFMFLEEEDYRLPESPTDSQKECHEDALEGLRFKKRDYQ